MQLLRDQVLIRPDEPIDRGPQEAMFTIQNGIHVPNQRQSPFATGTVIMTGEFARLNTDGSHQESLLKPGDRVLYRRHQVELFDVAPHAGAALTTESSIVALEPPQEETAKSCGEADDAGVPCGFDAGHAGGHEFEPQARPLAVVDADAEGA